MNKGIDHIGITSGHFDESAKLYQEGLGFRIIHTWGREQRVYMMDTGDGTFVELFEGTAEEAKTSSLQTQDKPHANGKWMHLALRTDNIEESYQRAIRAGFNEKLPPTYAEILEATPEPVYLYFAYIRGYDGEEIEFIQYLDGPVV